MFLWIVALSLGLVSAWTVYVFNRLVRLRNQMRSAWADIDVQLTRRHDLVPQLVRAVSAYTRHERAVLNAVTALRAEAMQQTSPRRLGDVEAALELELNRVIALQETYPELKASANFLALQNELVEIEEHLQFARRFYNGAVRDYNDAVQRVPDLLVARWCGFEGGEFYQARKEDRRGVQVRWP